MAFLSSKDLMKEMSLESNQDASVLSGIIDAVESLWSTMTNRIWTERSVVEKVPCRGTLACLSNYPVNRLNYICSSITEAFSVASTATSYASISVLDDKIVLNADGTSTDLTYSDYPTITELVAAITGTSLWVASLLDKGAAKSSELIRMMGKDCMEEADVYYPDDFLQYFSFFEESGMIKTAHRWEYLWVSYSHGYTSTTLPKDIKQLLIRQACHWYRQGKQKNWDYSTIDMQEGGSVSFSKTNKMNLLPDFIAFSERNRKMNI